MRTEVLSEALGLGQYAEAEKPWSMPAIEQFPCVVDERVTMGKARVVGKK